MIFLHMIENNLKINAIEQEIRGWEKYKVTVNA